MFNTAQLDRWIVIIPEENTYWINETTASPQSFRSSACLRKASHRTVLETVQSANFPKKKKSSPSTISTPHSR